MTDLYAHGLMERYEERRDIDYRVVAPHFVARITRHGQVVVDAAPILGWAIGKSWLEVTTYFVRKSWECEPL